MRSWRELGATERGSLHAAGRRLDARAQTVQIERIESDQVVADALQRREHGCIAVAFAEPDDTVAGTPGDGSMAALLLRPLGTVSMLGLMLHGAMGRLGEAAGVEHFEFERLLVRPALPLGRRGVKVAFDGEVTMMRAPLEFRVLARPLHLLVPPPDGPPEARA